MSGFLLQFCIKFTKACVGSLPSTLRCGESQNSCLCFLSSQHFVPLANVTAFKGVEKTREIYTVNHFCAETAEEGLSLACKHRRLCAAAAKKRLIYMCPPHSIFSALPLSLGFHPRDLSWRRCQEGSDLFRSIPQDETKLFGRNCSISRWIGEVGLALFVLKRQHSGSSVTFFMTRAESTQRIFFRGHLLLQKSGQTLRYYSTEALENQQHCG